MANKIALEQYGQKLQTFPNGQVRAVDPTQLSFDGENLVGDNYSFVSNLTGINGLPIGMDMQAPTRLVGLSQSQSNIMGNFMNLSQSGRLPSSGSGFDPTSWIQKAVPGISRNDVSALGSVTGMVAGNGITVRDFEPVLDSVFDHVSKSNDKNKKVAVEARKILRDYSPLFGSRIPRRGDNPFDLDNLVTGGAYQAVGSFQNSQGLPSSANPYNGFSQDMMGPIMAKVKTTKPGEPLIISAEEVAAFQNGTADNLNKDPLPQDPSQIRSADLFSNEDTASAANAPARKVAAVGLPEEALNQRQQDLDASNKRLAQIQVQYRKTEDVRSYTMGVIDELNKLVGQAQEIRKALNEKSAVPEVTQAVIDLQAEITRQQRFVYQLSKDMDELAHNRYEVLKDRQDIVDRYDALLNASYLDRVSSQVASASKALAQAN